MLARSDRLLLIAVPHVPHVGAFFREAATQLGLTTRIRNIEEAYDAPLLWRRVNWWLRGHLPPRWKSFSRSVCAEVEEFRPRWVVTTGMSALTAEYITHIKKTGATTINYSTDDPWNPAMGGDWFLKALPHFDHVFSTRRVVLDDLWRIGCHRASYLPFGYAPEWHFPEPPATAEERTRFAADVMFAGGADRDRVPYMEALIRAGFDVALYGGYWSRHRNLAAHARGHADPSTLRKAVGGAKVAFCLVRRANRDGSAMRSFEIPAIGACMLVEDTAEHRELFGEDGDAVVYFRSQQGAVEKLRWLLANDAERHRLKERALQLITRGRNTYRDRLETMLQRAER